VTHGVRIAVVCGALAVSATCERQEGAARPDGGAARDAGLFLECSVEAQDCPAGRACSLYARDGGLGSRCFATTCGLVAQQCDAGEKCTYIESARLAARACVAEGDAGEGEACAPNATSDTCRAGLVCVPLRQLDGGTSHQCLRFCHRNADCVPGQACFLTLVLDGTVERPLVCSTPCDLFEQHCPPGDACYPGPNVPGCYVEGGGEHSPVAIDGACRSSEECVRGAVCVRESCTAICAYPSGPPACATGTCTRLDYAGAPDAGVCL
jgi:hypothetical protein